MLVRRTLLAGAVAAPLLPAWVKLPTLPALPALPAWVPLPAEVAAAPRERDPHSHARPEIARVTHVSLDLTADFERKVLAGTATLTIERTDDAPEVVLDVDGLNIKVVRVGDHGEQTTWRIGAATPGLGSAMTIALPPGVGRVVITYETAPQAQALQWLEPAQTASGKAFMFSQGQPILTRTWLPTQDSPGIRQTYEARIVAPTGLKALMSAEMARPDGQAIEGGREYRFRMRHPIPPYLIALAVGDLEFREIGRRTGVWAEPGVVERAAWEFSDMEHMLEAAEALYGDYRWGRYDVLVLPPSFPYGGMENPRLTFATPTVLAGDRTLVSLIAHELAHSWSGNLVTNAVWADFWLNESFTTYIEGRICEALYGADQAAMANVLAWADIQTALSSLAPDATRLHAPPDRAPEEANSAIVYDKGALFLRTIEATIGRGRLDDYLRSYFDRHAFKPMTTERFLTDFRDRVVNSDDSLETRLLLDEWAYEPGLPANAAEPRADAFDRVGEAVAAFGAGGPASAIPWPAWGTMERQRFLQTLARTLPRERLDELDGALILNANGNGEVLLDWLKLAVRNGYEACAPALEGFLTRQGRRKYVQPLYRALMEQGAWGQALARRVYALARPSYHSVTVTAVDAIVTPAR